MSSNPETSTPTAVAKAFLAAIKDHDTKYMRSLCHHDATGCLIRAGVPIHTTMSVVLEKVDEQKDVELDEVSYDEVEHVRGNFAVVWTPYKFIWSGKLHHTGANNFTCWKSPEKGWMITAVQDIALPTEDHSGGLPSDNDKTADKAPGLLG